MTVASNQNWKIQVVAGENLSNAQFHAIEIDGTIAQNANTAVGILQGKPQSGEDGSLVFIGHCKARIGGGAITVGTRLTVAASGWLVAITSGDGPACARAVSAASSGGIAEILANFVSASTQYDQQ